MELRHLQRPAWSNQVEEMKLLIKWTTFDRAISHLIEAHHLMEASLFSSATILRQKYGYRQTTVIK